MEEVPLSIPALPVPALSLVILHAPHLDLILLEDQYPKSAYQH